MVYDLVADGDALPRGAVVILFNNRIVYPVVEQQYQLFVLVSVRIADDVLDGPLLLRGHALERGLLAAVLYDLAESFFHIE